MTTKTNTGAQALVGHFATEGAGLQQAQVP